MLKKLLSSFLLACLISLCFNTTARSAFSKQERALMKIEKRGRLITVARFPSEKFNSPRPVSVYLPQSYARDTGARYPVMYVHDAQWSDLSTPEGRWKIADEYDRLAQNGQIREMIIVGIWTGAERNSELAGAKKQTYDAFVTQEVKPFIDKKFRTYSDRSNTLTMGLSNGGTAALRLGCTYSDIFGKAAVISDGRHINRQQVLLDLAAYTRPLNDSVFWISAGTTEAGRFKTDLGLEDYSYQAEDMALRFQARGFVQSVNLGYFELFGGTHDFESWTAVLDNVYLFLMGKTRPSLDSVKIKKHYHQGLSASDPGLKMTKISLEARYSNGMSLTVLNPAFSVDDPDTAEIMTVKTYFDGPPSQPDTNVYPPGWKIIRRENISEGQPMFTDGQRRSYVTTGVIAAKKPGKVKITAEYQGQTASAVFEVKE